MRTTQTLESLYFDTIRPSLITAGKNHDTMARYDSCLGRFTLHRGGPTSFDKVTDKAIAGFEKWLSELGEPKRSIDRIAGSLRSIIHLIDPARFNYRGRPKAPTPKPAAPGTLAQFFEKTYWPHKTRGRSANNLRLYKDSLRVFEKFLGRAPVLEDLTDESLAACMAWRIGQKRSPETANRAARHLLALWRFAAKKRYLDEFPTVELLATPKRVPRAWLEDDLRLMFAAADKVPGMIAGVSARHWWTALLATIWNTGERIGAVLRLRWDDVDLKRRWIVAPAEIRKGGRRDKAFQLAEYTCQALAAIQVRRELVFAWPLRVESIYHRLKQDILRPAGLPTDRSCKFHRIRRSMASYYKAAGGDPTEALDHQNTATTRLYLDPRVTETKSPADLLFNPLPAREAVSV
jgi:site-specific recombinase XerD